MANEDRLREYLRRVTADLHETRQRLSAAQEQDREPIAVVAMSCRFPGAVTSPEDLWRLLDAGTDAVGEFPTDRGWDLEGLYDPDPDRTGTMYVRHGGFLRDAAGFDAELFGIHPREAAAIDPQQRVLLESTWELFERARIPAASLRDSSTGVFVGVIAQDYAPGLGRVPAAHEGYLLTGNTTSVASGRIAYTFGLRGPALTVDTACSSSLVGVHLACASLRSGEVTLAVAGGATVLGSAGVFVEFSRQRGLAPDGRCKSFAAAADGTNFAEGVGLLLLERLGDARRNGHEILAVIRGSAVNSDGASNGLTAPSGPAQERVIRAALARARVTAAEVDAVEAHGTGTTLGDPIEAHALLATYGREHSPQAPLWVGSAKSNLGHTQAAAGVAGMIKMILAMRHARLPATLHVDEPTPHVDWSDGTVRLARQGRRWEANGRPRRAAVSSFGISGTNAHLILEEAPAGAGQGEAARPVTADRAAAPAHPLPWLLSAGSADALRAQAARLLTHLTAGPAASDGPAADDTAVTADTAAAADDVALSLVATRSPLDHRAALVGGDRPQLLAALAALADSATPPAPDALRTDVAVPAARVAFLFTGQGSQRPGMGRELHAAYPAFAAALDAVAEVLDPHLDRPLRTVMFAEDQSADAALLGQTLYTQAAVFAFEVALARLLESWGLRPSHVAGHSIGEIAAAHVAGVLTLADAGTLVAARGRLMQALPAGGAMAAVQATEAEVRRTLADAPGAVTIAAVNGPTATVISGDAGAVDAVAGQWRERGRRVRRLRVSHAFHSPHMDGMLAEFEAALAPLTLTAPTVPLVSTLTGRLATPDQLTSARYWVRHVREPVRLADAVRELHALEATAYLEVGPDRALAPMAADTLAEQGVSAPVVATSGAGRDERSTLLSAVAALAVHGREPDWPALFAGRPARPIDLPTYPFQHQRHWLEPAPTGGPHPASTGHPLLGSAIVLAEGGTTVFVSRLDRHSHPWLADHAIGGVTLLPGTAVVETVLQAGLRFGSAQVEEIVLQAPLVVDGPGPIDLQVTVGPVDDQGRRPVQVHSRRLPDPADSTGPDLDESDWTRHATGSLAPASAPDAAAAPPDPGSAWPPTGAEALAEGSPYAWLDEQGYRYGPAFRLVRGAWKRGTELFADVELPEAVTTDGYGIHPALLDAALHPLAASATAPAEAAAPEAVDAPGATAQPRTPTAGVDGATVRLPFSWSGIRLHAIAGTRVRVRLRLADDGTAAVHVADPGGAPVLTVTGLTFRGIPAAALAAAAARVPGHDALHVLEWTPTTPLDEPDRTDAPAAWVGADDEPARHALAATGRDVTPYPDLVALGQAVAAGHPAPRLVVVRASAEPGQPAAAAVRALAASVLGHLRAWLDAPALATARLVVLTRGAVAAGEGHTDLPGAALWGLLHAAQNEHPGQLTLLDLDGHDDSARMWPAALGLDEPRVAMRAGRALVPRLRRTRDVPALALPAGEGRWHLGASGTGMLEGVAVVTAGPPEPLGPGEVRVRVRAAGLNFRDALIALGMYPGAATLGSEAAGVVVEVGADVAGVAPGTRVMGLFADAVAPEAVTDHRLVAPIPTGWSYAQAAAAPIVYLTAYHALVGLARVRTGQSLLVHAATGGVGTAALRLARHLGLRVHATASPPKWPVLRAAGLPPTHISSSRTTDFEETVRAATAGRGVDVVLNSLTGPFVDASLRLLGPGGHFLEMGKTDVRDAETVRAAHPGVTYQAFDLMDAGPDRIAQMLAELGGLFEDGTLAPLPVTAWDVRQAPTALRFLGQSRHVGKVVLTLPRALDPAGTALITGGTGELGGLVARHLVVRHGVRHLLLASRRGPAADGAGRLVADLEALGARVTTLACDVADRAALTDLLAAVPVAHPLTAVVHTAGVLDDAPAATLGPDQLDRVLRPKADAAVHLHELTAHLDLAVFVLYSSFAGIAGNPGQGTYAAANAILDALARTRHTAGLPATSLAWGPWAPSGGMTGMLGATGLARLRRAGLRPLRAAEGTALFDAALADGRAELIPVGLDLSRLGGSDVPPLLRALVRREIPRAAGADGAGDLAGRLRRLAATARVGVLVDLVRAQVAAVLGHGTPGAVEVDRPFNALGLDSLTAVELRNRLGAATGLRLPATLLFDYPTTLTLAEHLLAELLGPRADGGAEPATHDPDGDGKSARPEDGDPIAIVAMACRFPGGVRTAEDLWRLVARGTDTITSFPVNRGWDVDALYDPDPGRPGHTYATRGGFLHDADEFDAAFFGMNPREAVATDPQQRLLLETAWEVLERAGIDPTSLAGSRTGVFAGVIAQDYGSWAPQTPPELEGYLSTGTTTSVASGRIAYVLGLEGPAITVDTACSSSLVALHLAGQALRAGECTLALAGGATIMSTPRSFVEFSRQRGLAPDGRSKAFAAAADGTSWGEGVGVLLLERLSDARRNGHPVLALVRGTAVNQDGASNGLTAPNGPSQQRVIRQALANARLAPHEVDAVEAHGTGTPLGDPIEAQALLATYGQGRPDDAPLRLGSIKSNIGHTLAAAGVAGIIKMVMAMRHGELPRTLHVDEPSPHVDWSAGTVSLLVDAAPWPRGPRPRRAGVSSFGISGTNAHVILEEAPPDPAALPDPAAPANPADPAATSEAQATAEVQATAEAVVAWPLSARDGLALRAQADRLLTHLDARVDTPPDPRDVGRSLALGRATLAYRAVVVAPPGELRAGLRALARGEDAADVLTGIAQDDPRVVFVFPGQGSQWPGMATALLDGSPRFRAHLHDCADALAAHVDWSLVDVLRGAPGTPGLDRVDVVQPALFAILVSLARLWRDHGVHPAAVVGHSQGEIAAAHLAGGLTLDEAARVVSLRARALAALARDAESGRGAMVSLSEPVERVHARLAPWAGRLWVAAVNGPASTVVSGQADAIDELLADAGDDQRIRRIPVDYASHSPAMEALRDDLLGALDGLTPRSGDIPFYSTVTAGVLDTARLDAEYWYTNLRSTVRLDETVRALLADGHRILVESAPHPVLVPALRTTVEHAGARAAVVESLRRDDGGPDRFLRSLATAFAHGARIDWAGVFAGAGRVELPTYAFARRRYWLEAAPGPADASGLGLRPTAHGLLGAVVEEVDGEGTTFTGRLSARTHPWLADHAVGTTVLLPGTAFVEMAAHVADHLGHTALDELVVRAPLAVPDRGGVRLRVRVEAADSAGSRRFAVYSRPDDADTPDASAPDGLADTPWIRHATGLLGDRPAGASLTGATPTGAPPTGASPAATGSPRDQNGGGPGGGAHDGDAWPPPGAIPLDVTDAYDRLADLGLDYGAAFQGLTAAWRLGDDILAGVRLPASEHARARSFVLHPALFDAALHAVALAGVGEPATAGGAGGVPLPFAWSGVSWRRSAATSVRVRLGLRGPDTVAVTILDEAGAPLVTADALTVRRVEPAQLPPAAASRDPLFGVDWQELSEPAPTAEPPAGWAVLGDDLLEIAGTSDADPPVPPVTRYADLDALLAADGPLPPVVVVPVTGAGVHTEAGAGFGTDVPAAVRGAVDRVLELVSRWQRQPDCAESRLVLVTRGAVPAPAGRPVTDLPGAAVWGLARTAQTEVPASVVLLDVDASPMSAAALASWLGTDETQLAVRAGVVYAPRLVRLTAPRDQDRPHPDDPARAGGEAPARAAEDRPGRAAEDGPWSATGTVLITGGTGLLGGELARHLVTARGVRHLLLLSRGGAAGADTLVAGLRELGAEVDAVACDVADRHALARVLAGVPAAHPLSAVIHAAGVLDDGVLTSLTSARAAAVLRPKVDGAWNLHELTRHANLRAFVLVSSFAGVWGSGGQGAYAAASGFLDALAAHRRAEELPATAMAWGLWAPDSAMTGQLGQARRERIRRSGLVPLTVEAALNLFDAAMDTDRALVLPVALDLPTLRARAREGDLPPLLRRLVPQRARTAPSERAPVGVADLTGPDRDQAVGDLVRSVVAAVLGHPNPADVDMTRTFAGLGLDSLTALELRNRLGAAVGRRLPVTLVFDYPTPEALAAYLLAELAAADPRPAVLEQLDRLASMLAAVPDGDVDRPAVTSRLRAIIAAWTGEGGAAGQPDGAEARVSERLDGADPDELLAFIDQELGRTH
ncbi:ChlA5 [Frankia canadensis]|uniref:ChlA5 n=1 Tax=Frankia canadensis TaxID=1836972 RepID=A0A2I2KRS2_9ACTN|nr:type I polyketide synthase [Frankia canadensis]SNQ48352.1 ChlA5 [Frankia canadensis]SOU55642.1 ChlA5 [Frankia canadensis]